MIKIMFITALLFPALSFAQKGLKMKHYLTQYNSTAGILLTVAVNGLPAVTADGSEDLSGVTQINPLLKPGKNIIELNAIKLPSLKEKPEFVVMIQVRGESSPLYSFSSATEKLTLPFSKKIELDAPQFPKTELWSAENPGENPEAQILDYLADLRKQMIKIVEQRDIKGIMRLSEVKTRINSQALGMSFPAEMIEKKLKEQLETSPLKITPPEEINATLIIIKKMGENLFQVSRKNKKPLLHVSTGESGDKFNIGVRAPIIGKISGKWEILAD